MSFINISAEKKVNLVLPVVSIVTDVACGYKVFDLERKRRFCGLAGIKNENNVTGLSTYVKWDESDTEWLLCKFILFLSWHKV